MQEMSMLSDMEHANLKKKNDELCEQNSALVADAEKRKNEVAELKLELMKKQDTGSLDMTILRNENDLLKDSLRCLKKELIIAAKKYNAKALEAKTTQAEKNALEKTVDNLRMENSQKSKIAKALEDALTSLEAHKERDDDS
eukprot:11688036-Ditylum_brightwellii.AAC.1